MSTTLAQPVSVAGYAKAARRPPELPYRSLAAFRFADAGILSARDAAVERLVRLITMYRGVLLYGQSGAGKSSVVNAGLLPRVVEEEFWPHRVRVQPRAGQELVLEPIVCSDTGEREYLPSAFPGVRPGERRVVGVEEFEAGITAAAEDRSLLLVFDQFEELATLFRRTGPDRESSERILAMIVRLLRHETLRVKLLFVFREDYLAALKPLLEAQPELSHQSLRLLPPPPSAAAEIIRTPFENFNDHYKRELSPELAQRIAAQLADHSGSDELSLSELQIVCSRLWSDPNPSELLDRRRVEGLLEDHLDEALRQFPPALQEAALAALVHMVTPSGTRNVISAQDLVDRAIQDQPDLRLETLREAVDRLESESGLIRREHRHDVEFYELVSEFLIPRITARRRELQLRRDRQRERRRMAILAVAVIAAALVLVAIAIAWVNEISAAGNARRQTQRANQVKAQATYTGLTATAQKLLATRPDLSELLALAAYLHVPASSRPSLALDSLMAAREQLALSGVAGILHGHEEAVTGAAFDPVDQNLVASSSGDGTIRVWDTRTNRAIRVLTASSPAFSVAFSPDGRVLASAHQDGVVRVWDLPTGRLLARTATGAGAELIKVTFSPSGGYLAAAGLDGHVTVWRLTRDLPGQIVTAPIMEPSVRSIAFSSDSQELAAAGTDGTVRVFEVASGMGVGRTVKLPGALYAVAFRPGSRSVAVAGLGGRAWLWDPASGRPRVVLTAGNPVHDLAFSPDGRTLALGTAGAQVLLTDLVHPGRPVVLVGHTGVVTAVAFGPSGQVLASGSSDRTVRLWNLRPHRTFGGALAPVVGFASSVAFSHDGRRLGAAILVPRAAGGGVQLWDATTGRPTGKIPLGGARSVAFSPDGRLVLVGAQSGTVQLYSTASLGPDGPPILSRRGSPVYAVAFSRDGQTLAFAGNGGLLGLYTLPHGPMRLLPAGGASIFALAFSPDGRILASAGDDRMIHLWHVRSASQYAGLTGGTDAIFTLAFSPAATTLASGSADLTVRLWEATSQGLAPSSHPLTAQRDYIRSVAFSPDGHTLASASQDGTVQLWDVASRAPIGQPLAAGPAPVESVAFSPDGTVLASASANGAVRLWPRVLIPANRQTLSAQVCGLVGAGPSAAEWATYAPGLAFQRVCP